MNSLANIRSQVGWAPPTKSPGPRRKRKIGGRCPPYAGCLPVLFPLILAARHRTRRVGSIRVEAPRGIAATVPTAARCFVPGAIASPPAGTIPLNVLLALTAACHGQLACPCFAGTGGQAASMLHVALSSPGLTPIDSETFPTLPVGQFPGSIPPKGPARSYLLYHMLS
jgi:hypothetical protein